MKAVTLAVAASLLFASSAPVLANWTATGRFNYVDRAYNQTGFTGPEPQLPIRFADVHILDSKNKILASGATDASGNYSIFVVDSNTRTVYARVTSRSLNTSTLFIDVQSNDSGNIKYYAVSTPQFSGHNANTNLNFGTMVAAKGQGGEAFNLFDQMVRGADYIASLTGSRPGASDDLTAVWASNRGVTDSSYFYAFRKISVRDTAGYDDNPILHEMGHFFIREYSATSTPGGGHTFTDCKIDIREAYDEGYATYFGNSALRYAGLSGCNIYMRSNGGPAGPGSLVRYADLETDTQYHCQGDTSEVSIFSMLWDISDSTSTPDTTPGVEDSQDLLSLPDSEVWQVTRDYMPTATNRSFEDWWDGWFKAPISNGFLTQMSALAAPLGIVFSEDSREVNNSAATAEPISIGGGAIPVTFFYDQDGDGAGDVDVDYYVFSAAAGQAVRAETTNLISDANTFLEILDTDGSTVLASNNDRVAGDESSLIDWTAPRADTFYVRASHFADWGIYGSYTLLVTAP